MAKILSYSMQGVHFWFACGIVERHSGKESHVTLSNQLSSLKILSINSHFSSGRASGNAF